MTLSRTARILIAILLLAAAAFFWVNFFYRDGVPPVNVEGPEAPGADDAPAAAQNGTSATPGGSEVAGTPSDASDVDGVAGVEGVVPGSPADGDVTVVAPEAPEVVTRDVDIAELPFLVTEPPADSETGDGVVAGAAGAAGQQASRRVSVNPFSPIVIQAAAPAATAPPSQPSQVTDVAVPTEQPAVTTAARQPVTAPAPRPLAPPAPRADGLPRQLPGGTPLSATPDLLRQPLTMPEIAPGDLGSVAAFREPGADPDTGLAPVDVAEAPLRDDDVQPLGTTARVVDPETPARPMESGVDVLSRYLRDNNVVFTGSVLGPVSVGVFRTAGTPMPLVVSLGQTLPETDIVLTDLTGLKAEFTLADSTQVLSLDLRR